MENIVVSPFEQQKKGTLLYESKGGQNARGMALIILGALLLFLGIFVVRLGISTDAQRQILHGRFANPESVVIFGAVVAIIAAFVIDSGIGLLRCWVKIYNDHIEAQAFTMTGTKNIVQLNYSQINSVQMQGYFLNIISGGKKIRLICEENSQAFQLINTMIPHT